MKVVVVAQEFSSAGGAEKAACAQVDALERAGHAVRLVGDFRAAFPGHDGLHVEGIALQRYDALGTLGAVARLRMAAAGLFAPRVALRVLRYLRAERPDVVHLHRVKRLSPVLWLALRAARVPVVATLHDHVLSCPNSTRRHGDGSPCALDRCSARTALARRCVGDSRALTAYSLVEFTLRRRVVRDLGVVDAYLFPSRFLHDWTVRSVGPLPASVLPNFVPDPGAARPPSPGAAADGSPAPDAAADGPPAPDAASDAPPAPAPAPGSAADGSPSAAECGPVLYVGRLSEEKGVALLPALAERLPGLRVRAVGDGPMRAALQAAAGALTRGHLEIAGPMHGDALRAEVQAASMVLLPSTCFENGPLSLIEAMAQSRPMVAADIGGIPELVAPGRTGLLHRAGDADDAARCVARLAADPALRARLGRGARDAYERSHAPARWVAALLETYRTVFARRGAGQRGTG